jgi:hypothetical protein
LEVDAVSEISWEKFFSSLTEEELEGVALIRVIECTNGCIQYAFRGEDPRALPVEQTREAMKYSMGSMKSLDLNIGGRSYKFSRPTEQGLREIRELYVKGFKQNDDPAMDAFYESSYACVEALGEERLKKAVAIVKENLQQAIPPHTVDWGFNYLMGLKGNNES